MQDKLKDHFLKQIDAVLGYQEVMRENSEYDDLSGMPKWEYQRIITMALAAIERIAGRDSVYAQEAQRASKPDDPRRYYECFKTVVSMLESLREDLAADYLDTAAEIIHASVFADFLEMSRHLLDEGYKDAAAVIAGSSLEAHLRQLCNVQGIDTKVSTSSGRKPKKADRMNADLMKAKAYSQLDHKNVTAWLDLRNKAAHGEYDQYNAEQVGLLASGIQDFLTRNPA